MVYMYSPIRNLAILEDFVCITTSNSHHSRDGGSVRGLETMELRVLCIQCSPGSLDSEFVNTINRNLRSLYGIHVYY